MPRLKSEVRPRSRLRGWNAGAFFHPGWRGGGRPTSRSRPPRTGPGSYEDEEVQALGAPELAVLQAEAARLGVAEHGLDTPPEAFVEGAVDFRRLRHRYDPR